MFDLDRVGGVPVVMKRLLEAGLLHGDCMTVTGKTVEENLEGLARFWRYERREDRGRAAQQHRRTRVPVRQPRASKGAY